MLELGSLDIRNDGLLSDEALVELAKNNDKQATFQLISRFLCAIEARAKSFANGISDDLIQEGLMGLLKAIQTYDPEKNVKFYTYAMVCVKNRMISVLSKDRLGVEGSFDEQESIELYDASESPENIVVEKVRLNEIYDKIISSLSELEWRVFQMYLSGLVYNQIALELNVSTKVVDNAMQRVRRKLKAVLR